MVMDYPTQESIKSLQIDLYTVWELKVAESCLEGMEIHSKIWNNMVCFLGTLEPYKLWCDMQKHRSDTLWYVNGQFILKICWILQWGY